MLDNLLHDGLAEEDRIRLGPHDAHSLQAYVLVSVAANCAVKEPLPMTTIGGI
jgi:hypothetical protein